MAKIISPLKFINKFILFLVGNIFAIIAILIGTPLSVGVQVLFWFCRQIVIVLAKCKLRGATLMNSVDSFFATGTTYTNNDSYISFQIIVEGKICIEEAEREWMEKIILKKYPNGKLKFSKLRKSVRTLLGYSFWKLNKSFDVKNHISLYKEEGSNFVDKDKLVKIREDFQEKLFPKRFCVWEMLIVNNYRQNNNSTDKECSVVIFKFHHSLADVTAIAKLFWLHLGVSPTIKGENCSITTELEKEVEASANSKNILMKLIWMSFSDFKTTYKALFYYIYNRNRLFDIHPWHLPIKNKGRNYKLCIPDSLDKSVVANISDANNVSVSSIIIATVTGAMRKMMLKKHLILPDYITMTFIAGKSRLLDNLSTRATFSEFRIPLSHPDPIERLKKINTEYKDNFNAYESFVYPFLSTIPHCVMKSVDASYSSTNCICVSIPFGDVDMFGCPVISTNFFLTTERINPGVAIACVEWGNSYSLTIKVQNSYLKNAKEVEEMETSILEEFSQLKTTTI